jgi:hypothetical protein
MPAFLGMCYINEPFTSSNELDDFLNLSVDLIERTREQIQLYNEIIDTQFKLEVKKHIAKNLLVLQNGMADALMSINGDLVI